jgi:DNA-binding beta-propeller fold protein YncE
MLRWNPKGITIAGITSSPGTASNRLNRPWDLALDWSNTLYITDRYNNRVQKYLYGSSNGTTIAGRSNGIAGLSSTALNNPSGISIDPSGNFYVGDMLNHRVEFFVKNNFSGVTIAGNGIVKIFHDTCFYLSKLYNYFQELLVVRSIS